MVAGPDPEDTWYFNPVGPAPGNAFSWGELPNFSDSRLWSTAVLEPGGPAGSSRVTIIGGTPFGAGTPLKTSITFDDANPGLGWQSAPPLNIGRAHHNTVLLPDGSKLAVGGGVGIRRPRAGTPSIPIRRRSSSSTRPADPGASAPLRPRAAPTTRLPCCSPTGA